MMGGVELPQRAIREQIVMAVGVLVQLQRTASGPRIVHSITEIQGMEGETVLLQDIFHRVDTAEGMGRLVPTGLRPKILDELSLSGVEVPPHIFRNEADSGLLSSRGGGRHHRPARPGRVEPPTEELYEMLARRARREVRLTMLAALQLGSQTETLVAAVLVGAGLAIAVVAMLLRVRTRQRTLAQILDDTMGTAQVPVEVVSESPERGELSALTVRLAGIFGRIDTGGVLEQRLDRAAIPLRSGEYLVISAGFSLMLAVVAGVLVGSIIAAVIAIALGAMVAWYVPTYRANKRIKQMQEQLPDARSRSWQPRSRVARPSSEPSTCTGGMPGPPCHWSSTG